MIHLTLQESESIEMLHPEFKTLFDFVKNNDLYNTETGRIELNGNVLYINNINPEMLSMKEQILEAHINYIDIHIPLDKTELIGWKPTDKCTDVISAYKPEDDFMLFADKPTKYKVVNPGEFLIVYPEDAHAPIVGEGKIRKLIAKVRI